MTSIGKYLRNGRKIRYSKKNLTLSGFERTPAERRQRNRTAFHQNQLMTYFHFQTDIFCTFEKKL